MASLEAIAAKVASIRGSLGLSREDFAQVLRDVGYKTTSGTILNLELRRTASVDLFLLLAIAKAGRISLEELLGDGAPSEDPVDSLARRFVLIARSLPEAEVESHLRALELLAEERRRSNPAAPGRERAA